MKSLRRFFARLAGLATRRAQDERLREEIEEHIALQTAENIWAGLSPVEARRQAMLKFGGVEAIKEDYRAERGLLFIENLLQEPATRCAACDTRPNYCLCGDYPGAGDRHDLVDFQHGRCADLQALPRAASGRRGHFGEHHAR